MIEHEKLEGQMLMNLGFALSRYLEHKYAVLANSFGAVAVLEFMKS